MSTCSIIMSAWEIIMLTCDLTLEKVIFMVCYMYTNVVVQVLTCKGKVGINYLYEIVNGT